MNEDWTVIHFDGAAEPTNPGPASGAAIIDLPTGESLTVTVDLGVQTNNVAEYSGAIAGLKKALELGCQRIKLLRYSYPPNSDRDCYNLSNHESKAKSTSVYKSDSD
ncbi:MAG: reverse transcriptase-like protein [Stigonema ocellatum SAG 48.90 = DSM 106950]|nr:reverse transcriptase-like protein [Stigonema ocellatum SAG 48.90 = DSM 106950]